MKPTLIILGLAASPRQPMAAEQGYPAVPQTLRDGGASKGVCTP
jgi:hypothetical protein